MNIHPLFVHFPIALLTVYAVMEFGGPMLLKILKVFKKEGTELAQFITSELYKNIKAFLVIVGAVLGFPTLQTGEMAEHAMRAASGDTQGFGTTNAGQLIELHSTFATASVWLFAVLAVAYILKHSWFNKYAILKKISDIVLNPCLAGILAVAGIILLTITGALGGAITYGPDVDPIVQYIYNWFF